MSSISNVGILGMGIYLPPTVRTNDWWPAPVVQKWREKLNENLARPQREAPTTPRIRGTLEGIAQFGDPPLHGAGERRLKPSGRRASDTEDPAAQHA